MQSSRWVLKGAEDLGGGLKAVFNLENGFNPNNGALTGGLMFERRASVGLSSTTYGTVVVGRQQDTLNDLVLPVQPNYWLEYFTAPGDVDNADGTARVNSAVKWTSVKWRGIQAAVMYGFGGQAGATGSGLLCDSRRAPTSRATSSTSKLIISTFESWQRSKEPERQRCRAARTAGASHTLAYLCESVYDSAKLESVPYARKNELLTTASRGRV